MTMIEKDINSELKVNNNWVDMGNLANTYTHLYTHILRRPVYMTL